MYSFLEYLHEFETEFEKMSKKYCRLKISCCWHFKCKWRGQVHKYIDQSGVRLSLRRCCRATCVRQLSCIKNIHQPEIIYISDRVTFSYDIADLKRNDANPLIRPIVAIICGSRSCLNLFVVIFELNSSFKPMALPHYFYLSQKVLKKHCNWFIFANQYLNI